MVTSFQRDRLVVTPEARRATVLAFIRGAERTLCFTIFRCDDADVARALAEASARGVEVRVIVSRRAKGAKWQLAALTRFLVRHGVKVVRYKGPFTHYHAKYAVADDARALVGTLNYTAECFSTTTDFLVETAHREVVTTLAALFDHDARTPWRLFRADARRLIIGPDQSRQRWSALLGSARAHVRIVDRKLSDPDIEALIDAQIERGVVVVRSEPRSADGRRLHGKALVVDGRIGVVGSQALSRKSLDLRREVSLVLEDPAVVRDLAHCIDGLTDRPLPVFATRRRSERAA